MDSRTHPGDRDILAELDQRAPTSFYWQLRLLATLGGSAAASWQNAISLSSVMVCFAGLALGAVAFVYWFLPETKGRSVEEVIQLFEREAKAPS